MADAIRRHFLEETFRFFPIHRRLTILSGNQTRDQANCPLDSPRASHPRRWMNFFATRLRFRNPD